MNERQRPTLSRGDIIYADLEPVVGSEQGGVRPVLILQNNTGNRFSPTVIVAAITSNVGKHQLPTHVVLTEQVVGLRQNTVILLEQIRTLDKKRLGQYIGTLSENTMREIDRALSTSVGLEKNSGARQKRADAAFYMQGGK
jgi:mRNA interferase MazF